MLLEGIHINLWMITSNQYCNSIYKLDCILYATFLAKNNLVAKTFVTVHKIAYSYTTISTVCNICTKSVITNIKLVTNNIEKINGSFLKHIIIIRSHYTTVDCNIKQAYIHNHDLHISMLWLIYSSNSTTQLLMDTTYHNNNHTIIT